MYLLAGMASLDDARIPPEGTVLDGKYRLVRFLAQGGMGAVYEAQGPDAQRLAIKVMLDTSKSARESGAWARFLREAQVSSSLSSPHIVKVSGGGIDPDSGSAYLAMEFLGGEDLDSLLERVGALHPQVAVRLVLQACRGLSVAHEAGIIHRDIKPANLFLENRSGEVTVKICDFGIAKVHPNHDQQHLTGTGHVLGSPIYMAPEQVISSKRVDHRADVWSLAMTLYHALAGQAPLAHLESFTELVLGLTMQPIPALQEAAPWVSPGLAAVVHGALLRDPEARCPSIADFLRALEPHSGGGDDVTAGMLVGLPPEQRNQQQIEATLPASWQEAVAQNREADPLLGKVLAGKYTLVRILGEGGMGAVYEAHTEQGGPCACKIIRPDLVGSSPDAMKRLMREARTSMRLDSPHVVRVTEVDNDMTLGLPFIAMELLRGLDLSALVSLAGPLEPSAVCRLFVDACKGLGVAHAAGIVHRDIKPANIFLHQTSDPRQPLQVKVCDFGIAKQTDVDGSTSTELTRTGGLLGSPLYMSPEQAKNAKSVDHRTDIWSLAMALYEALAGQKAWAGFSSPGELVLAICTQDVRPLQDAAPWVGASLADAVHRALHRNPAQRYASVDEFAQALAPHAAGCPVLSLEALRSLTQAQKNNVAERSPNSRRSSVPGATSVDSTRDVAPASSARPSAAPRLAVGITLVAVAAAAGAWMLRGDDTKNAPAALVATPAPDRASASVPQVTPVSVVTARVPVSPPDASVTVGGRPRPLVGGALELSGESGQEFDVEIDAGGSKSKVTVILTRDGKAIPAAIDASKSARVDPKNSGKNPGPKGSAPAATPPAAKADTKPPSGLGAQTEWR